MSVSINGNGTVLGVTGVIPSSASTYTSAGAGAVATTVQTKLRQIVNVTDYGADPTGFVPCDTAFAAAVTYAKTLSAPELVINAGAYTATGSLTFDLPNYSTITFIGVITSNVVSDAAVRIGSTATNTFGLSVRGIKVQRSVTDTSGGSSGVQLRNLSCSYVDIRLCTGFQDGVFCYGDKPNGGFSYNEVHMGLIHDNKRNVYLNAGTTGYCNENNFYGGTFNHSSTYPAIATTNLEIANYAPATLNNNRFYGPSFEDNSTLATAAVICGSNNVIYWPRMENPANQTGYQIQFTVNAIECRVIGHGFTMVDSNISDLGSGNMYETREGAVIRYQTPATAGKAVLKLQSYFTSGAKALSILDSGGVERAYVTGDGDATFHSVNTSIPTPTGNFVTVTASSNVLVGATTSAYTQGLQLYGTAANGSSNAFQWQYSANTSAANLLFVKTRGTTATVLTPVISGDLLGTIAFAGPNSSSAIVSAAGITAGVDGAVTATDVPTSLSFQTGTTTGNTRMTISSAGLVTVNGTLAASSLTPTNPLDVAYGGTNIASYTIGDIPYASASGVLSKLADVATGNAIISGGVGVAPSYGKIGLTTHVNGTLPVANGGTNATTASITSFNNITGYTASGATGTTSTNLVFSASPTITGTLGAAAITASSTLQVTGDAFLNSRVLVGGPTTSAFLQGLQLFGSAANSTQNAFQWCYSTTNTATTYLIRSRATTPTGNTAVINGDTLGSYAFGGTDGTNVGGNPNVVATTAITSIVDNTVSANTIPSSLVFSTGTTVATSRMVISSAGVVTMSNYGAGTATFSASGVISSVSDETLKIKDGVIADPIPMIMALEPGYYFGKPEANMGDGRQLGFYAQNVRAAIGPEAAPDPDSKTLEDGTVITKPWGYFDRSVLAVAVEAIKAQQAQITALTARIAALEAK